MTRPRAALPLLLLLVAACGGPAASPAEPTLARLPSVTPALPTAPPTAAPPTATPAPTATAAPPTATPGIVATDDGPVTPSMAELGLAAEPYAAMGDPEAPITVVEFADFGCHFCHRHHLLTFGALREEYIDAGTVYYVYKDLPVTSVHGALAAQAAECAGAQGRYWEMHDALYADSEVWSGDEPDALARVRAAAGEVGLDAAAVEACVAGGERLANVDANFAEAQALRLLGTPAFFINGKLLAGAHSAEVWRQILDDELAQLGAGDP